LEKHSFINEQIKFTSFALGLIYPAAFVLLLSEVLTPKMSSSSFD